MPSEPTTDSASIALVAPTGPSPHLPEAGHRSGKGHADRRIELADVDPQLERVGGDYSQQLTVAETPLDLLALAGGVASAIGRDPLGQLRLQTVHGVTQDQLHALARFHEADRPRTGGDQFREQLRGLRQSRAAQAERLVDQRRVPHRHPPGSGGRAVAVHECEVLEPGEPFRQLYWVGDRRAREQEARHSPVGGGEPA